MAEFVKFLGPKKIHEILIPGASLRSNFLAATPTFDYLYASEVSTVAELLDAGVRYLDIDIIKDATPDYVVGYYKNIVTSDGTAKVIIDTGLLAAVDTFITANAGEIVILDF